VNQVRKEGATVREALLTAGPMRLRPILITAATTCLGLVPLALGFGAGIELQQPLAITLIGGVASSTILTLVIIPIVYTVFTGGYGRAAR
jgi:HAE1 family hydrophobic/amphiphilic exporter-1